MLSCWWTATARARRPAPGRSSRRRSAARFPIADAVDRRRAAARAPGADRRRAAGCASRTAALGVAGAETALLVPLVYRGRAARRAGRLRPARRRPGFGDEDEQLFLAFAASAATAVATARTVAEDRLRHTLDGGRARAAPLGARAARRDAPGARRPAGAALVGAPARHAGGARAGGRARRSSTSRTEIDNLRSLITELRPAALDELGLASALESLGRAARRPSQGSTSRPTSDVGGAARRRRWRRRSTASSRRRSPTSPSTPAPSACACRSSLEDDGVEGRGHRRRRVASTRAPRPRGSG